MMFFSRKAVIRALFLIFLLCVVVFFSEASPVTDSSKDSFVLPWWCWSLLLLGFCFVLGIIAIVSGVGGGILYVPIVSAFFPFHLDFVRGSGLLVALAGAISATPLLLNSGMASLNLALPMALVGSIGSLVGANLGLLLSGKNLELILGFVLFAIVILMILKKQTEGSGEYSVSAGLDFSDHPADPASDIGMLWNVYRVRWGLALFFVIGLIAGMFGMGAGWANVPVLNLLIGLPLKVSVATSVFIIAVNGSVSSWVYLNQGAVLPAIAVPSVAGMMLGTRLGVRLLGRARSATIRWVVIAFLLLAGLRSIFSGFGIME